MIELRGVGKSYDQGETWVVRNLDLGVREGELLVLLGESGCGKTTTLKMINRLIDASEGEIHALGGPVSERDPVQLRRSIGYVFQGVGLFPHLTVEENVGIVPRLLDWTPEDIDRRTRELLELVNLPADEFARRLPKELSGGQRQRVGVARALAARPKIVLMDEPFGALDPLTRDSLQIEFRKIHDELGLTTVVVTHDMMEALILADRIAVMQDGAIVQLGTPRALLTDPKDPYVELLMKKPREQARVIDELVEGEP